MGLVFFFRPLLRLFCVGYYFGTAVGLATSSRSGNGAGTHGRADEEEDLIVDGDETVQFGPAQYSEADVIAPRGEGTAREQKERDALREAVISPNAPLTPHTPPDQPHGAQVEVKPEPGTGGHPSSPLSAHCRQRSEGDEAPATTSPGQEQSGDTPVVDALRSRIRELENEMRGQPFKCLICMVSNNKY